MYNVAFQFILLELKMVLFDANYVGSNYVEWLKQGMVEELKRSRGSTGGISSGK